MIQGVLLNVIIGLACSPLYVTRGLMGGFGLNQFEADLNSGDRELILYDIMQAGSLLGSFCCKCFTGDTLVRTEQGFTRIDEIRAGDYVLAENIETGKKEYRKVLKVYVKEATSLVHLRTDGTKDEDQTIDTTANHPFYVEGRGWVAAENIEIGDRLHTEDGSVVRVTAKETEKLKKPVKVYNLEVEGYHTYYVTKDEVLVHNMYGKSGTKRVYNPSPKHDPQTGWGSPNPIPDIETGQTLLDTAYSSQRTKQLYNIYNNDLIKFQPDTVDGWHAYSVKNPVSEVPIDVLRQMLVEGKITKSQYKKFIKNE